MTIITENDTTENIIDDTKYEWQYIYRTCPHCNFSTIDETEWEKHKQDSHFKSDNRRIKIKPYQRRKIIKTFY